MSADLTAELEGILADAISNGETPGAGVEVRRKGETVARFALGALEGVEVTPDSVWWVASLTKPIVAVSALIAQEAGLLRLEDLAETYVPELTAPRSVRHIEPDPHPAPAARPGPGAPVVVDDSDLEPATRKLAIRDFLTGTAGLQTIGVPNEAIPRPQWGETLGEFVPKLAGAPLDFQPGAKWHYSNATAFEVVARCIEVAAGQSFEDFVTSRIFEPLGMASTTFGVRDRTKARQLPLGPFGSQDPILGTTFFSGSAGLLTTLDDYSNFAAMLLRHGEYAGARILTAESVAALASNQIGDLRLGGISPDKYGSLFATPDSSVGYGYAVLTLLAQNAVSAIPPGSFGWDGMGSRRFWVVPAWDTTIVVLADGFGAGPLQRRLEASIAAAVAG